MHGISDSDGAIRMGCVRWANKFPRPVQSPNARAWTGHGAGIQHSDQVADPHEAAVAENQRPDLAMKPDHSNLPHDDAVRALVEQRINPAEEIGLRVDEIGRFEIRRTLPFPNGKPFRRRNRSPRRKAPADGRPTD